MTYRPYPSLSRAQHQLDRHVKTTPVLPDLERFAQGLTALRSAGWTAEGLTNMWKAALGPRPAGSDEKTG